MKTAIIYNSETGFTQKYALWLAEDLGCEAFSFKEAKRKDFSAYDALVFGSWFHAGMIQKLKWFKKQMDAAPEKKYAAFAVGANPSESGDIQKALAMNFPAEYSQKCPAFYCPGGLNYGKMRPLHRLMMTMFAKMMANKKDKTPEEAEAAEMMARDYDISNRKYLEPLVEYMNRGQA